MRLKAEIKEREFKLEILIRLEQRKRIKESYALDKERIEKIKQLNEAVGRIQVRDPARELNWISWS